ncbi:MAG: CheR family methyltransferase [Actinomycetota bacterium]
MTTGGNEVEPRLVVAIGASAGGLEPLQNLVGVAPVGAGIAYVVLQHLSPDHRTLMQSLLSHHTQMPVVTAEHGMEVRGDAIYLLPARHLMTISGGVLLLEEQIRTTGDPLRTIDRFMISLAEERGEASVAIILSGTGSDGADGVRAVRAAGGFTIAQDSSAAFGGMPESAVRTGAIDRVLEPHLMPDSILAFAVDPDSAREDDVEIDADAPYGRIIDRLEESFGIDFASYKPSTVHRRISRRFDLTDQDTEADYLERVVSDPDELARLYHDLLIGVTQFFRDGSPWVVLREVASELVVAAAEERRDVRAWVAGCATGEEAYSVAMVLHEAAERAGYTGRIRIFASDADPTSIETAGLGTYSAESVAAMSSERRSKYFVPDGDRFRVTNEVRRLITFTTHNLLSEAPFTRLDLVTCRNLLIYLRPEARAKALALLHFSLRTGGALFLGNSESVEPYGGEFAERDTRSRVYTKTRDVRLIGSQPISRRETLTPTPTPPRSTANEWLMRAYDDVLDRYGPTGFLIDEHRRLLHVLGSAGRLLEVTGGRVTGDLLDQLDESLRVPLWGAIQQAFSSREDVAIDDVVMRTTDEEEIVRVLVSPLPERLQGPSVALVVIEAGAASMPLDARSGRGLVRRESVEIGETEPADVVFLERELQLTRETLQSTVEELEASNEELVASNEELQSTNEELQSVNEELHTVNSEYSQKITELTQLTNDLDNLMASSGIGTLFLDSDLGVRRYTQDLAQIFRLRPGDLGRSIEDLAPRLGLDRLYDRLRAVVETGERAEEQTKLDGRSVLVRLNPYLVDGMIDGVVLTLVNVDVLIETQEQLAAEAERFDAFMANSPAMKWALDELGRFALVNETYCEVMGVSLEECLGRTPAEALAGRPSSSFLDRTRISNERSRRDGRVDYDIEVELEHGVRWMQAVKFPFDYRGRTYLGGSAIDVTESRGAQVAAEQSAARMQELLDSFPEPVWSLDADGRIEQVNAVARSYSDDDPVGRLPVDAYGPDVASWLAEDRAPTPEWPLGANGPRHLQPVSSTTREGGRLVVGLDLSDLVEAQRLLERRNVSMAERNIELDQFAHMASHDLRAPIRAIHLMAQQALAGEEDPGVFAEEVAATAERMRDVIDSLLAYANVGRHEVNLIPIELDLVVESVSLDLRAELAEMGGRIEKGELPVWHIDPVLVRRALMNLVENALVHGRADEPIVRIEAHEVDGFIEIDVIDNGNGIADYEGIDIFDPFTRVNASHDGSGMGLAIARRVAQRHDGSIRVMETGPKGTTIRLRLAATEQPDG